jgi:TRAP-type C4-dicarboxylate transport system permease small subunit
MAAAFWRVIRRTEDAGELVASLALWGIVALIFFQVFFRYVLQTGLSWPDELARYFHIIVVFFTLGAVSRRQQHIRIDYFRRRLRSRALDRFSLLTEVGAAVILAGGAAEVIRRLGGFRTPAMEMPLALFFLPTAVGFTFMALESGRWWLARRRDAVDVAEVTRKFLDRNSR